MSDLSETDGIEDLALSEYTEKAYLNYSMYVILDRALPHIGDGLKPVQRRIVYAMSELGLKNTAKYKKSARTVGDVLGKYHPHGDSACYEAMVLMAQSFSYRYPLVDGQGNWGAPDDPKSFAAMRYTESRLTRYADSLLQELQQGTVDWQPNFDGTMDEPSLLPARLPNVLLNGSTGIAVGMSTDIPSHNLREVVAACVHMLKDPGYSLDSICEHIQGPDYPTEAEIITPRHEIISMYASGRGSVKMRACYEKEDQDIVITALPHQVSGAKIMEQIAAQMNAKKLPLVADLRDESDHENATRIVLVPRSSRVDLEPLMSHLFATTDLEKNYRVNLNVIGTDGRPQVKGLQQMLEEWIEFRLATVRRRLQFRLDKIMERLHILEGYMIAFLNIDEVIAIVRNEDHPKMVLIERFGITERQADAILDLKLRQLAKLEEIKIRGEQDELEKEREGLEKTLGSNARMKKLVVKELEEDAESYGDERRSPLIQRDASQAMDESDLMSADPVTVVLSAKGWVRCAKGHDVDAPGLNYKVGDEYLSSAPGKTNQSALFLDSTGRCYALPAHTLPSARGLGEPLSGRLNPPSGASFKGVMMGADKQRVLLTTDGGYGFIAALGDAYTKNKNGKALITVPKGSMVMSPQLVSDDDQYVVAVSNEGRMLMFPIEELPQLSKGKGNKLLSLPAARVAAREEFMLAALSISEQDTVRFYAGKRHLSLKFKDLEHYLSERGRRGLKLPRGFQKVERVERIVKE